MPLWPGLLLQQFIRRMGKSEARAVIKFLVLKGETLQKYTVRWCFENSQLCMLQFKKNLDSFSVAAQMLFYRDLDDPSQSTMTAMQQ